MKTLTKPHHGKTRPDKHDAINKAMCIKFTYLQSRLVYRETTTIIKSHDGGRGQWWFGGIVVTLAVSTPLEATSQGQPEMKAAAWGGGPCRRRFLPVTAHSGPYRD